MRVGILLLAASYLGGCGGEEPALFAVSTSSDSVGTVQVRLQGDWDRPAGLLQLVEQYTVGENIPLYGVTDAQLLSNGALVIANSGNSELLILDAFGELVRTVGRRGQGPGEYQALSSLLDDRTEHGFMSYDARLGRMAEYEADGALRDTWDLNSGSVAVDLFPLASLSDGSLLVTYGQSRVYQGTEGAVRDRIPLVRIGPGGGTPDTLGIWAGREWYYAPHEGGVARLAVGFGREIVYAGRNGRAVIGTTDSLNLQVFDGRASPAMRIAAPGRRLPVQSDSLEAWRADLASRLATAPPALRRLYVSIPAYDTYPDISGVGMGAGGEVLIGLTAPGEDSETWLLLALTGEMMGTMRLPSEARVLDLAGSRLVVLHRDELDQEFVSVFSIENSG